MFTNKWTPEVRQKASDLWISDKTCAEIARELGPEFTRSMVSSMARKNRNEFPRREPGDYSRIEIDIEKAALMWNGSKMTNIDLARHFGVSDRFFRDLRLKHTDKFFKRETNSKKSLEHSIRMKTRNGVSRLSSGTSIDYKDPPLDTYEQKRLPGVPLMENEGCKYALTSHKPHMFCGCKRLEMKPYCAYHVRKTQGVGTRSERSAIKDARRVA